MQLLLLSSCDSTAETTIRMPPRTSSAGKHRSKRPIFAGVDRQAPHAQRPKPAGGSLRVIGERCRLFEDESGLAAELEAGQHLLPCFGDEGTTVDRFDARLLLAAAPAASRSRANAPAPSGQEDAELDAERYRDLWREGSEPSDSDADDAHPRPGLMTLESVSCIIARTTVRGINSQSQQPSARFHRDCTAHPLVNPVNLFAGGAAIPHDYGGSAAPGPSFQQVGFDYGGQQPGQLAVEQCAAPERGNPEQPLEQQGDPFVAPFAVPDSLHSHLPATMQQHKVGGMHASTLAASHVQQLEVCSLRAPAESIVCVLGCKDAADAWPNI